MSAKGLPPAVRLDPLPLLYDGLQAQKMTSPTSTFSPNRCSPQPQTQTLARGLTPIIITPESSSRPHTPLAVGGSSDLDTPGLTSMMLSTTTTTTTTAKRMKFEFKVEPVELDPILPSVKREKVRAVWMDEDEGSKLHQLLPTPCMTPVLHAVDMIRGGGRENGDKSPSRTGRTIVPDFRSRPDDPEIHRNPSLSDLADVAEREWLVYGRGRTRERRRKSRFREEKKGRCRPYDPAMRSIKCATQSPASSRLSSSTPMHPSSHFTGTDGPSPPIPHQPTQPPSPALPAIAPPYPIPKAADHLIHLFNAQLQIQIQAERDSLRVEYENLIRERREIQRERELMKREREGRKWCGAAMNDRETMELREENRMLRVRVEELQVKLDNILREAGRPSSPT